MASHGVAQRTDTPPTRASGGGTQRKTLRLGSFFRCPSDERKGENEGIKE
jgi:hypothetical protein